MNRKILKIRIMPQPKFQAYTIAIAKGRYKPKPDEPKIWFASMEILAQVLSDENQALLEIIDKTQPNSIQELAETIMNIESLRDDPTAQQLIEILFPDKLEAARAEGMAKGKAEGKAEATEDLIRRFGNTLSEEQIKQFKDESEEQIKNLKMKRVD